MIKMIHQGLGGGSSNPQSSSIGSPTWMQNWFQQSSDRLWNPTTSYDTVDDWRDATGMDTISLPGLGGGMDFPGWAPLNPPGSPGSIPPAAPPMGNQNIEGMMWLLLGLM